MCVCVSIYLYLYLYTHICVCVCVYPECSAFPTSTGPSLRGMTLLLRRLNCFIFFWSAGFTQVHPSGMLLALAFKRRSSQHNETGATE